MSRKGENIYKRKDGRWEGCCKKGVAANGRIIYGSCYGKTYREAKEKLEKYRQMPPTGTTSSGRSKRFSDYCDEWLLFMQTNVMFYAGRSIKYYPVKEPFGLCI